MIRLTEKQIIDIGLSLATGSMKFEELCKWLNNHN